jgi:hypothetical protein
VVDEDYFRRGVIEQKHDLSKQTMACAQIDDTSTPEPAADTACDFPGFEELFPRQAARGADGTRDAIEMRVGWKTSEIVAGETGL